MSKNNSWHKGYGFALVLFLVSVLLTGCPGTTPPPKTFTIGGTVAGLTGTGLVLQNNGGNNLSISANATSFTFAMAIVSGTAYNVTVVTQPTSPAQTCTVTNAAGTVADVNITNVAVACVTDAPSSFTIGGTVS
ncbi:MAG: hypothetical protein HY037_04530, partial [Nitrospirae bacterium]|nr:hypothetical protein [Candidatus Troglogloeales bacterium]